MGKKIQSPAAALGSKPAFPGAYSGMTLREYYAGHIMAALAGRTEWAPLLRVEEAVMLTDLLLDELAYGQKPTTEIYVVRRPKARPKG